jgi:hypothetical protein
MTTISYMPFCHICNTPVALEFAKTDELGRTVHEGCYLLKVNPKSTGSAPSSRKA